MTRIDFYEVQRLRIRWVWAAWDKLRDAYIREYNSFHEYGGWGIRTGKLFLIGTKRPEEIQRIINTLEIGRAHV